MAMSSIGIARGPGANRRASPRRGMLPPIVMADFAFQEGVLLRDLSEAGLGAHALVSPAVGTSTNCTFELPDHGRIEAHGIVTWSDNSGRFGLRFDHVHDAAQPRLKEWLVRQAEPVSDYGPQPDAAMAGPADDLNLLREQLETGQVSSDAAFHLLTESIRAITGATGAAIAVEDEGAFVCRASSGAAPEVGAHLDPSSGLSGECIRTADTVRCADTESDPRVDRLVCRKLEIRSVVIVPILRAGKVAGVIEVFSSSPHAFQNNAVRLLRKASQVLAVVSPAPQSVAAVETMPQGSPEAGEAIAGNGKLKSAPAAEIPVPPPVVMKPAVATKPAEEPPEAAVEPPPFVPLLSPLPQPEEKPGADAKADQVLAELRAKKLAEVAAQQKAADKVAQERAARTAPLVATTAAETVEEEAQPDATARRQLLLRVVLVALLLIAVTMAVWRFWPRSTARPQPTPPAPSAPVSAEPAPVQPSPVPAGAPVSTPAASPTIASPQPAARKTAPNADARAAEPFEEVQIKSVAVPAPPPPAQPEAVTPPPIPVMANSQGNGVSSLLATSVRAPVLAESAPTSTGVTGGKLKTRVEPAYPATARALALSGTVVLNATVDTSGRVVRVTRVSGNPILAEAAASAVRRWVYEPFVLNGKPVQTNATITVKFAAP